MLQSLYGKDGESSEDEYTYSREGVMICSVHNEPLNFWSDKLKRYQCIRCLVDENQIHFIDMSYK